MCAKQCRARLGNVTGKYLMNQCVVNKTKIVANLRMTHNKVKSEIRDNVQKLHIDFWCLYFASAFTANTHLQTVCLTHNIVKSQIRYNVLK